MICDCSSTKHNVSACISVAYFDSFLCFPCCQVEKAFREGTARQNAHSIFVSLALKLLEERVHVACKEIITLEKQVMELVKIIFFFLARTSER